MARSFVIIGGILVALLPWMSGGSDPLAVLISAFGLLITAFLLMRPTGSRTERVATVPLRVLAALWLGWGALSLIWSVNRYDTELWLLYAMLAVAAFALTASLSLADKLRLLEGYVWVATVAALYGAYLYFTADYDRLTSSFYWANPAAAYLLPAALLAGRGWLVATKRWSWTGWLRLVQTLILASAVWLTDSRGAILAAAVVLVGALVLSHGFRRRALPVAIIIVLSFGIGVGLSSLRTHIVHQSSVTPGSRFAAAAEGESTSVSDRLNYLRSALSIWEHHPLLGTGAGTYGVEHPQYQRRVISAGSDAHNIFAQDLAEQGLIGWLIFIYLLIIVMIGVARGIRREPVLAVVAGGAAIMLIHLGLDIDDRYPAAIMLLAVLAGSCYRTWLPRPLPLTRPRLAIPAIILIAVILAASAYQSSVWAGRGSDFDAVNNLPSAAEDYARAHTGLMYDPTNWTAEGIDYYSLASITGGSKSDDASALYLANGAIARDGQDSQNYFLRARIERLSGNTGAALADYRHTIQLDPWNHPDYYLDLVTLDLKLNQTAPAQRLISQVLALYPDSVISNRGDDTTIKPAIAELLTLQAAGLLQDGHTAAAHADLIRSQRLEPTNQDTIELLHLPSLMTGP